MSAGTGTGADVDNGLQVDFLEKKEKANTKTRKELEQTTHATQTSIPARTVVEMDTG